MATLPPAAPDRVADMMRAAIAGAVGNRRCGWQPQTRRMSSCISVAGEREEHAMQEMTIGEIESSFDSEWVNRPAGKLVLSMNSNESREREIRYALSILNAAA